HFGARRMILAGDVEEEIDAQLLAAGIARGGDGLDLLKVAHHGSGTATTDAFVEQMKPQVAVVSAGSGNPYGHPSPQTVARLVESGAKLFRTDLDGSVEISTNGVDLVANAAGGRPRPTPLPTAPLGAGFCPIPQTGTQAGRRRRRTYNREDVDPDPDGSSPDPSRARSARLAGDPQCRRSRGRHVPCSCHRRAWARHPRAARGSGGAPS
ncbi:MAG: ComEC/Rec2 family competence protein, partial [Candidatus Limnocylindrales bacterium]